MTLLGVLIASFGGTAAALAMISYASKQYLEQELRKDLEVFRADLERQLDRARQTFELSHSRYSQDYSLFATRRNEIYWTVYSLLKEADDAVVTLYFPGLA